MEQFMKKRFLLFFFAAAQYCGRKKKWFIFFPFLNFVIFAAKFLIFFSFVHRIDVHFQPILNFETSNWGLANIYVSK
jgi:hypothetical protein